jgi:hypothetical protein
MARSATCAATIILILVMLPFDATGKEVMIVTSGSAAPDTCYLSRNAATLQRVPLDGVATWIATPVPVQIEGKLETPRLASGRLARHRSGDDRADVGQTLAHRRRISESHIAPAIADLQSADFNRFDSNFIHCITGNAPGPMNWFDDQWWNTICHNIGMLAKAAKQGACRGLLIDPEVYSYAWWGYPMLTETDGGTYNYRRGNREFYQGKTVSQVQDKVRQRGREFAQAINAQFKDPVLMFFHAAGYTARQVLHDPLGRWPTIDEAPFGLMVPFIDGMLEGSTDQTIIVDCTSQSKWWVDRPQLEAARKLVKEDARSLSQVPELYDQKMRVGFTYRLGVHPQEEAIGEQKGVPPPYESWMYNPAAPDKNFFSPEKLEETLKLALEIGDGYVLFWNYRANWWLDSPTAVGADGAPVLKKSRWVPPVYWQALENARNAVLNNN